MGQVFGEICLISQIISFFACLGISCLRTLPAINCACRQVRMIASIDERFRSESAYFRPIQFSTFESHPFEVLIAIGLLLFGGLHRRF